MARNTEQQIRCSFCGKRENQAQRLIAGPGVYICGDCVKTCSDLLRDDIHFGEEGSLAQPEQLPTPAEIKAYMDGYIIGQENDTVIQQTGENVKTPLAAAGLLNNIGNKTHGDVLLSGISNQRWG